MPFVGTENTPEQGTAAAEVDPDQGDSRRDHAEETSTDSREHPASQSTTSCPFPLFSATFPTYRIDLSGSPSAAESKQRRKRRVRRGCIRKLVKPNGNAGIEDVGAGERRSAWGTLTSAFEGAWDSVGGWPGWQTARKSAVEDLYHEEIRQGSFRWTSVAAGDDGDDAAPHRDNDFVAAAAFWRTISDVAAAHHDAAATSPRELPRRQWYLALPATTRAVAQGLCDVANWYDDDAERRAEAADGGSDVRVRADVDARSQEEAVPVVRFTARSAGRGRRRVEGRGSLPTAEDTERRTKAWVNRMLVQLGICPFTKSASKVRSALRQLSHVDFDHCVASDAAASERTRFG